jgi:REP element-mobilizing transposase RayT
VGILDYKEFTRRRRPHFNPVDATLFVTFRLAGSIPKSISREYKAQLNWLQDQLRRVERLCVSESSAELIGCRNKIQLLNREWFLKTEEILHRAKTGPTWLSEPSVASKLAENLKRLDSEAFSLDAYSIMSNHVHTVFEPLLPASELLRLCDRDNELFEIDEHIGLSKIMFLLKGRSARECNLLLGRRGSFWEQESFDRVVRAGKFDKTIRYVLNNPVKVGLVKNWEDWPWNYCREEIIERFRSTS